MQHLLAEKDTELARQYRRMEMEASERSQLRHQFNAAIDEVKALRGELEDARQAMLELKVLHTCTACSPCGSRRDMHACACGGTARAGTCMGMLMGTTVQYSTRV